MTSDPMTLAQLRLAEALLDALDGTRPGSALVIRRTLNGGVECPAIPLEAAIRQVREVEAREGVAP